MIVSHRHRFIFLKTKKTAGTSVELALARICGDSDIITPTDPNEEIDSMRTDAPPRNFVRKGPLTWPKRASEAIFRQGKRDRTDFYHHMPAKLVKQYVGKRIWDGYFKFTVERNPWDRQLSYYKYLKSIKPALAQMSFSEFTRSKHGNIRNSKIYMIDGALAVDAVLAFESLPSHLGVLCNLLGLPTLTLPRVNVTKDEAGASYQKKYDEHDKHYIEMLYATDIKLFGYNFDQSMGSSMPYFSHKTNHETLSRTIALVR